MAPHARACASRALKAKVVNNILLDPPEGFSAPVAQVPSHLLTGKGRHNYSHVQVSFVPSML